MRYLDEGEIQTRLNLGKSVEQWLPPKGDAKEGTCILSWLTIYKAASKQYTLVIEEVYDDGNVDYLDIYTFSPVKEYENPFEITFETLDELWEYMLNELKIKPNKFLNEGMAQKEYLKYLNAQL